MGRRKKISSIGKISKTIRRRASYETAEEIDKRIDALIDMMELKPEEMEGLNKSTDEVLQEIDDSIQEMLEEMERNGDLILSESHDLDKPLDFDEP